MGEVVGHDRQEEEVTENIEGNETLDDRKMM